jgi:hypothetical protein
MSSSCSSGHCHCSKKRYIYLWLCHGFSSKFIFFLFFFSWLITLC